MQPIKNILFDLGGVLLNVDYKKTTAAFQQLGFENFNELFSQFTANELFEKLETGRISEDQFYQLVQQYSDRQLHQKEIETAWNAMLLDFRTGSLDFLASLQGRYNLFLLSNTNSIHLRSFQQIFSRETGKASLDTYFIKSYYSHMIGMRKPYKETYQFVLEDSGLTATETLFVDDSINNIEGALELGIRTHLLLPGQQIEELAI